MHKKSVLVFFVIFVDIWYLLGDIFVIFGIKRLTFPYPHYMPPFAPQKYFLSKSKVHKFNYNTLSHKH